MEKYQVKFKNLKVGYYFIFEDKLFLKVNDFGGTQLFSNLKLDLFTSSNSHFTSVNANETDDNIYPYSRPAGVLVTFEPDDMVDFIKYKTIREYVVDNKPKKLKNFKDIMIGSYFKDHNTFYIKTTYNNASPIYNHVIGLDDIQDIKITAICSAIETNSIYNKVYYNGKELLKLNNNAVNVIWFDKLIKNYNYGSFDLERNWYTESNRFLDFLSNIPEDCYVYILTSNNLQITSNIKDKNDIEKHVKRIYSEYENAEDILSSFGIEKELISNLGRGESIFILCMRNREKIFFKKLSNNKREDFIKPGLSDSNIIEFSFSVPLSEKSYSIGSERCFFDDDKFEEVSELELYGNVIYNLTPKDDRLFYSDNLFDFS